VERVIRAAFGRRRKTLVNALRSGSLSPVPTSERLRGLLAELSVGPQARGETLTPAQFLALARALERPGAEVGQG
jgi:16S rRNA (adenine1518-N6/adenine1519-N6)-dimethyltransferase